MHLGAVLWFLLPFIVAFSMPPKSLSGEELQQRHGGILSQPPLSEATSAYLLHKALTGRVPPVCVSMGAVKTWWTKYRLSAPAAAASSIESAGDFEQRCGDRARALVAEHPSAYKLCKALRDSADPVFVSDGIAKQWLRKFSEQGDLTSIENAGHLELHAGEYIREHFSLGIATTPEELGVWLRREKKVSVSSRTCQTWMSKTWSSSGVLLTREAVEEVLGERLRLPQYRESFSEAESLESLKVSLAESQPPAQVSVALLLAWHTKYHPDSGALRYATSKALEEAHGEELRTVYGELPYKALRTALGRRRKAVLVSLQVAQSWYEQYGAGQPPPTRVLKRPASAAVLKRPSSAVLKRPSSAAQEFSPSSSDEASMASASSASTAGTTEVIEVAGHQELEKACGFRYRREVTDLGLGFNRTEMQQTLLSWGFQVSRTACDQWLKRYRIGEGGVDGSAALYLRSRQDLQRWYSGRLIVNLAFRPADTNLPMFCFFYIFC